MSEAEIGNGGVQRTSSGVEYVRTDDDRFVDLIDWPYVPQYVEVDGLRMAYVDERPAGAGERDRDRDRNQNVTTLLLLHGEPTWAYLYRRMIPTLVAAGYRVVAPDLIGFGRSDKPTDRATYTYAGHVAWMTEFVNVVGLRDITLFCQDWGGLIGLRVAAEHPDLFSRLIIANTALPDGEPMSDGFMRWQRASQQMERMDCGLLLQLSTLARELTEAEMQAYRAPFPDETSMAGPRQFPLLVPTSPDDPAVPANLAAWKVLEAWAKPVLTLWAPDDPVLGTYQAGFANRIPGASGQPHQTFSPAGHFIQEDAGELVADAIVQWIG
jgi:haloalkane dehalogenase